MWGHCLRVSRGPEDRPAPLWLGLRFPLAVILKRGRSRWVQEMDTQERRLRHGSKKEGNPNFSSPSIQGPLGDIGSFQVVKGSGVTMETQTEESYSLCCNQPPPPH